MAFDYEKTAPVRFPYRRHGLVCYLYELANPLLQREKWVNGTSDETGVMYGFSFVIDFFFDETDLAEHPEVSVGEVLLDELEVAAVRSVGRALNQVYGEVGLGKSDYEYISSSNWPRVVEAALKAYRLLRPRVLAEGDDRLPPELPI